MRDGPADRQQSQSRDAGYNDSDVAMPPKAQVERDRADGNDDNEHLQVKVVVAELSKERKQHHCKRQQQAMDQAETG